MNKAIYRSKSLFVIHSSRGIKKVHYCQWGNLQNTATGAAAERQHLIRQTETRYTKAITEILQWKLCDCFKTSKPFPYNKVLLRPYHLTFPKLYHHIGIKFSNILDYGVHLAQTTKQMWSIYSIEAY